MIYWDLASCVVMDTAWLNFTQVSKHSKVTMQRCRVDCSSCWNSCWCLDETTTVTAEYCLFSMSIVRNSEGLLRDAGRDLLASYLSLTWKLEIETSILAGRVVERFLSRDAMLIPSCGVRLWSVGHVHVLCRHEYHTIRYDSVYLTCSKKVTGSQLGLPYGIDKKLKCETKNKLISLNTFSNFFAV